MNSPTNKTMYPRVKVRHQVHKNEEEDDDGDARNPRLKVFIPSCLRPPSSPSPYASCYASPASTCPPSPSASVVRKKNVSKPSSMVNAPKCYVPPVSSPRVQINEAFQDCSLSSDSGSTGPEKDDSIDENKINTRACRVHRPRAVISSPYNDRLFGSRNETSNGSSSPLKNGTPPQNRHAHCNCKAKSHEDADNPLNTRKSKEPDSNGTIDPVGKKKVHHGSIKSENVNRIWRY
ncbi:uncharacterized protein LOC130951668 [Arachis stenosperma]|nr:uncharacterized protein LOC112711355 [Arachis hypogaea]XP_057736349.1 uncharacterized protein LOC130951668 [Arachis stenosperma]QHO35313.1 uncharacterized protein DS421_9g274430 [Arachis hypogaea]RYR38050.1 hypothetical protein Ahy_A09g042992 isoform B [Arachis hypogaea]